MVTKHLQTLNLKFDQVMFYSLVFPWERNFEVTFGIFSVLVFQINVIESYLDIHLYKLISDVCKKTTFSFNNQLYEQLDGVSMGSSLGPILANIIMTELENILTKDLLDIGTIAFYARYVDDTSVLVKPNDVQKC